MTVINTNIAASITANSMKSNARVMETAMERLSTGKRINSASDDAAGLGIETRMTSQIRGLQQATRSSNDGIAMLQTADGALAEIGEMFQRMREIAVQSGSGTLTTADKSNLNQEFMALAQEIDRTATDTTFNNTAILGSAAAYKIQVGADETDVITFNTKDMQLNATATYNATVSSINSGAAQDLDGFMTSTALNPDTTGTIEFLDDVIVAIASERASYGATINRLEYAVDTLGAAVLNTQAARSQIVDADYASETTELARTQIIAQASTAMLSQANQQAQSVLALLK